MLTIISFGPKVPEEKLVEIKIIPNSNIQSYTHRSAQATRVPSSVNAPTLGLYLAILCMNGSEF